MLTGAIDDARGAIFTKASKRSGFGQVFQNNMDNSSFSGNTKEQIEKILLNSQYAYFNDFDDMRNKDVYKNCQVIITFGICNKQIWKKLQLPYRLCFYALLGYSTQRF